MSRLIEFRLVVLTSLLGLLTSCQQPTITLVKEGISNYVLIDNSVNSSKSKAAVKLLKSTLHTISGYSLPIVEELPDGFMPIMIAQVNNLEDYTIDRQFSFELALDEFIISNGADGLFIFGGSERACLDGVIHFLGKELGCRWYAPDQTSIPKAENIILPYFEYHFSPTFSYRDVYYPSTLDSTWVVLNHLTPHATETVVDPGIKEFFPFTHSFYHLLPPLRYYEQNPEYYSLINGKRTWKGGQLCLSNLEVRNLVKEQVIQWVESGIMPNHFTIDQMDYGQWCECDKCMEQIESFGGISGYLLDFVNDVASGVHSEYPEMRFSTLAYLESESPPEDAEVSTKATIRLCRWNYCNAHSVEYCDHNQSFVAKEGSRFRGNLQQWTNVSQSVYVWDYHTDFSNYLMPYPNFSAVAGNVKYYRENNIKGVFAQGSGKDYSQFSSLNAWILSQMLWNPAADGYDLRREFCEHYYKGASSQVLTYLELLDELMSSRDSYLIPYSGMAALPPKFLLEGESLLNEALNRVLEDSAGTARIERELLCHSYAQLQKAKEGADFKSISNRPFQEVSAEFKVLANRHSILKYREVNGDLSRFLATLPTENSI